MGPLDRSRFIHGSAEREEVLAPGWLLCLYLYQVSQLRSTIQQLPILKYSPTIQIHPVSHDGIFSRTGYGFRVAFCLSSRQICVIGVQIIDRAYDLTESSRSSFASAPLQLGLIHAKNVAGK